MKAPESTSISRRDFVRSVAAGGAGLYVASRFGSPAWAAGPADIGQCKSVKVRCISETSWFDGAQFVADVKNAGGMNTNQYVIPWNPKNSGGYSALVEVEALNGTTRRFLLDTGWNPAWMEYSYQREGIDDLLRKNQIEFLFLSHEHLDHFWGLPVVLKYRPDRSRIVAMTFCEPRSW